MHENILEIEDLLCDDSFINYCKNVSPQDIEKWISFSNKNDANLQLVQAAKERFIQVFSALAMADREEQEHRIINRLNMVESASVVKMQQLEAGAKDNVFPLLLKITASVAIVLVVIGLGINYQSARPKADTLKTFSSPIMR